MNFNQKEASGRTRNVPILFWVTEEEKKMILSKTSNMSAYLRKAAIDCMIVNVDTTWQKKQFEEMHKIGVNVNQLAKQANTVGAATPDDVKEMKGMLKEIWHILKSSQLKPQ